MGRAGFVLFLVLVLCNDCLPSRVKFRSQKDGEDDESEVESNITLAKEALVVNEKNLRYQASIIVVFVFFTITFGMFCCCRFVPELIMDRCNY